MPIIIDNPNPKDAFSSFNFDRNWLTITKNHLTCGNKVFDINIQLKEHLTSLGFKGVKVKIKNHANYNHVRPGEGQLEHFHIRFAKNCNIEDLENMKMILTAIDKVQPELIESFGEKTPIRIGGAFRQWLMPKHCYGRLITDTSKIESRMNELAKQKEEYKSENPGKDSSGLCFFSPAPKPLPCNQLPSPTGMSNSVSFINRNFGDIGDKAAENAGTIALGFLAIAAVAAFSKIFKCGSKRSPQLRR